MKILFLCVANSARSQMAEGLAKKLLGGEHQIESAGSQPGRLNPLAVKAMDEIGIDISRHYSKSYDKLPPRFLASLNYMITLCAEEVCPSMVSRAKNIRWPLNDPAGKTGTEEERLNYFRHVRDRIEANLKNFAMEIGLSETESGETSSETL